MGCRTCSYLGPERPGCECTNCKGDLCNKPAGNIYPIKVQIGEFKKWEFEPRG